MWTRGRHYWGSGIHTCQPQRGLGLPRGRPGNRPVLPVTRLKQGGRPRRRGRRTAASRCDSRCEPFNDRRAYPAFLLQSGVALVAKERWVQVTISLWIQIILLLQLVLEGGGLRPWTFVAEVLWWTSWRNRQTPSTCPQSRCSRCCASAHASPGNRRTWSETCSWWRMTSYDHTSRTHYSRRKLVINLRSLFTNPIYSQ